MGSFASVSFCSRTWMPIAKSTSDRDDIRRGNSLLAHQVCAGGRNPVLHCQMSVKWITRHPIAREGLMRTIMSRQKLCWTIWSATSGVGIIGTTQSTIVLQPYPKFPNISQWLYRNVVQIWGCNLNIPVVETWTFLELPRVVQIICNCNNHVIQLSHFDWLRSRIPTMETPPLSSQCLFPTIINHCFLASTPRTNKTEKRWDRSHNRPRCSCSSATAVRIMVLLVFPVLLLCCATTTTTTTKRNGWELRGVKPSRFHPPRKNNHKGIIITIIVMMDSRIEEGQDKITKPKSMQTIVSCDDCWSTKPSRTIPKKRVATLCRAAIRHCQRRSPKRPCRSERCMFGSTPGCWWTIRRVPMVCPWDSIGCTENVSPLWTLICLNEVTNVAVKARYEDCSRLSAKWSWKCWQGTKKLSWWTHTSIIIVSAKSDAASQLALPASRHERQEKKIGKRKGTEWDVIYQ